MKTIRIDEDIHRYLLARAGEAGEPIARILRRELRIAPPSVPIEIDDDVYEYLAEKTQEIGESPSSILRRQLQMDPGTPVPGPTTVTFRIPAATGSGAWNTREQQVVASVGDTLRVVNGDSVAHRLHTSGRPFPHPEAEIAPGASADYVLRTAFDAAADRPLEDHLHGPTALFWITVRARA